MRAQASRSSSRKFSFPAASAADSTFGLRVPDFGSQGSDSGFQLSGYGLRKSSCGFWVLGFGHMV